MFPSHLIAGYKTSETAITSYADAPYLRSVLVSHLDFGQTKPPPASGPREAPGSYALHGHSLTDPSIRHGGSRSIINFLPAGEIPTPPQRRPVPHQYTEYRI